MKITCKVSPPEEITSAKESAASWGTPPTAQKRSSRIATRKAQVESAAAAIPSLPNTTTSANVFEFESSPARNTRRRAASAAAATAITISMNNSLDTVGATTRKRASVNSDHNDVNGDVPKEQTESPAKKPRKATTPTPKKNFATTKKSTNKKTRAATRDEEDDINNDNNTEDEDELTNGDNSTNTSTNSGTTMEAKEEPSNGEEDQDGDDDDDDDEHNEEEEPSSGAEDEDEEEYQGSVSNNNNSGITTAATRRTRRSKGVEIDLFAQDEYDTEEDRIINMHAVQKSVRFWFLMGLIQPIRSKKSINGALKKVDQYADQLLKSVETFQLNDQDIRQNFTKELVQTELKLINAQYPGSFDMKFFSETYQVFIAVLSRAIAVCSQ